MLTAQAVTLDFILVCFVGGFFIGMGWTLGAWVISRLVSHIP